MITPCTNRGRNSGCGVQNNTLVRYWTGRGDFLTLIMGMSPTHQYCLNCGKKLNFNGVALAYNLMGMNGPTQTKGRGGNAN